MVKRRMFDRALTYIVIAVNVFAIAEAVAIASFWISYVVGGILMLDLGFFYIRAARRKKLRYPLIPPEGRTDWYLPTTNIPRPVIKDYREIEEKKRKFSKLNKKLRKPPKPKRN